MTNNTNRTSIPTAALVAGLAILTMVMAAPVAELYVYPKLVLSNNAIETVKNLLAYKNLFVLAIFCYLITSIADIVAAWALHILLKPVNENLSLLTAWFRLVYTILFLAALLNLVNVYNSVVSESNHLPEQIMFCLSSFRNDFHFALIVFSFHLLLLGFLVFVSGYIPKILGVLLIISGLGYLMTSIKPFLFPNINLDFAVYTFYGELIFMAWLIIKGSKLKEPVG